jgi:PLD-like domain
MSANYAQHQKLLNENAAAIVSIPGVLAAQVGTRVRQGRATGEPAIVVTVERKIEPEALGQGEDLRDVLGPSNVDVVQATPLKALFAAPEKYGVDAQTLADLEARIGNPFGPGAIGPATRLRARLIPDHITYRPPDGVKLQPLKGRIKLRCHAGPDAGWKALREFLLAAEDELVVGMYELTGPHIGDLLAEQVADKVSVFKLTMDKKVSIGSGMKEFDRTEKTHARMFERAFGDGFEHDFAFTKKNGGTFFSDYHIKLAVRDRTAFWLSSGSWQSSNQPNLDPLGPDANDARLRICNREWHVIGVNDELSDVWAKFLEWDLETALDIREPAFDARALPATGPIVFVAAQPGEFPYEEFFAPADFDFVADDNALVMPLLTPDNYIEEATRLIESAKTELLVQNQSLGFLRDENDQDPRYTTFTKALARQSRTLAKFKLIIRDPAEFGGSASDALDIYRDKEFDVSKIRFQPRCHNKGIIADGERVLIGSHNFTNAGTTANRDASLVVHHKEIAAYYAKIFAHDWRVADGLARHLAPAPRAFLALPGEMPPPGMRMYRLWDMLDDD